MVLNYINDLNIKMVFYVQHMPVGKRHNFVHDQPEASFFSP